MPTQSLEELMKQKDAEAAPAAPHVDAIIGCASKAVLAESEADLQIEREAMKHGDEVRKTGYRMYLDGKTPGEIATGIGLPGVTSDIVMVWARDGDWAVRLQRQNDAREKLVRENVRRIRLGKIEDEAESSLRISKKIRDVAETMLEEGGLTPMGLKNVADATKASGDLGAHGLGESSAAETAKEKGKTPLVMIFPGGGLPPMPKDAEVVRVK